MYIHLYVSQNSSAHKVSMMKGWRLCQFPRRWLFFLSVFTVVIFFNVCKNYTRRTPRPKNKQPRVFLRSKWNFVLLYAVSTKLTYNIHHISWPCHWVKRPSLIIYFHYWATCNAILNCAVYNGTLIISTMIKINLSRAPWFHRRRIHAYIPRIKWMDRAVKNLCHSVIVTKIPINSETIDVLYFVL